MNLYENQEKALRISINNDFKSGVHFHATGTGKSLISLNILIEYNKKNPNNHIIWLCEQKSILNEQFSKDTLHKKGFSEINKYFSIFNLVSNKKQKGWCAWMYDQPFGNVA